jgi:hypothetical protein
LAEALWARRGAGSHLVPDKLGSDYFIDHGELPRLEDLVIEPTDDRFVVCSGHGRTPSLYR